MDAADRVRTKDESGGQCRENGQADKSGRGGLNGRNPECGCKAQAVDFFFSFFFWFLVLFLFLLSGAESGPLYVQDDEEVRTEEKDKKKAKVCGDLKRRLRLRRDSQCRTSP